LGNKYTRLLLVHACSLDYKGGAELSLLEHLANAPRGVEVDVVLPDDPVDLSDYDSVILSNLRPAGGLGEEEECRWARLWAERIRGYPGYVIKSEHDVHPCATRDGRCVQAEPLKRIACNCGRKIPDAFEKLYNLCDAIHFLSPLHRRVINQIIKIKTPRQYDIACPINLKFFQNTNPFHQRKHLALITGDAVRIAPEAYALAEAEGYPVEHMDYLSVSYDKMPDLLNQYKAVVVAPVMLHAFCRLVVEAQACGCKVITNDRVGAMSWPDPVAASNKANGEFWRMVADRPARPNPGRLRRMAFWK
jgi:glycosyltransferase involved in cell wall biosynthesis